MRSVAGLPIAPSGGGYLEVNPHTEGSDTASKPKII